MASQVFKAKTKPIEVSVVEFEGIQKVTIDGHEIDVDGKTHLIVKGETTLVIHKDDFNKKFKVVKPKSDEPKKPTPLAFIKFKGLEAELKSFQERKLGEL